MNSFNIQIIKTINTDKWEDLIASSDTSSFFQTKACFDFYCSVNALTPFVYAVQQSDHLVALACGYIVKSKTFPINYFSRRAIIPGGLLIRKNCQLAAIELLLMHLKSELEQKTIYIEIRNFHDYNPWKSCFQNVGFDYVPHYNVQNKLEKLQYETLLKTFADEKQRQLKSAASKQITCNPIENQLELAAFYELLSNLYSKDIKLPLFPIEFFVSLYHLTNAVILVVKKSDQIIGGIVLVHDHKTIYEWFVCGKKDNQFYPSVVATAAGLQWAVAKGLKKFDFMGAGNTTEPSGIRNFKLRFGGELVEHGRYLFQCNTLIYRLSTFYFKQLKKYL